MIILKENSLRELFVNNTKESRIVQKVNIQSTLTYRFP